MHYVLCHISSRSRPLLLQRFSPSSRAAPPQLDGISALCASIPRHRLISTDISLAAVGSRRPLWFEPRAPDYKAIPTIAGRRRVGNFQKTLSQTRRCNCNHTQSVRNAAGNRVVVEIACALTRLRRRPRSPASRKAGNTRLSEVSRGNKVVRVPRGLVSYQGPDVQQQ